MKTNFFALVLLTVILGACSQNNTPDIDNTLPVIKQTEVATPVDAVATDAAIVPSATVAPVTIQPNNPLPAAKNNSALNPPHGAPGHDCGVAVGAPLNGSGKSVSAPVSTPVSAPVSIMPNATVPLKNVSANGVRLNPAHGEPGHDCNVQVGQPLS